MTSEPVPHVHDNLTNDPALVVHLQIVNPADFPIDGADPETPQVFRLDEHDWPP